MAYHNSEQVYEPRLESVSNNGYQRTLRPGDTDLERGYGDVRP